MNVPFAPQPTESALQGPSQVLYLVSLVNGYQILTHLRVLGFRTTLTATPTEVGRFLFPIVTTNTARKIRTSPLSK